MEKRKLSRSKRGNASAWAVGTEAPDPGVAVGRRFSADCGLSETADTHVNRESASDSRSLHQRKRRKLVGEGKRQKGAEEADSSATSSDTVGRGVATQRRQHPISQQTEQRGERAKGDNSPGGVSPRASREQKKRTGSPAGGDDRRNRAQQESRKRRGRELDIFSDDNGEKGKGKSSGNNRNASAGRQERKERPGGKARWTDRAVDVPPDYRSSRLIVKNLPPYITTTELKQKLTSLGGEITDVCLLRNERGKSRQCAFVGFKTQQQAANVKDHFHNTFIHTRKVEISFALPRATPFSSERGKAGADTPGGPKAANAKKQESESAKSALSGKKVVKREELRRGRGEAKGKVKVMEEEPVGARKAGVSSVRTRVLFDDGSDSEASSGQNASGGSEDEKKDKKRTGGEKAAVSETAQGTENAKIGDDDEADDLAWLRQQSARAAREESDFKANDGQDEDDLHSMSTGPSKAQAGEGLDTSGGTKNEELDFALLGSHGRLLIQNLPFATAVDELRALCEEYGEVAEAHLVVDEETRKPRGFGFVTFVFPEHAVAALPRLNGSIFQGRLLGAFPARPDTTRERRLQLREERRLARQKKLAGSSYKARKLEQLVNQDERFAEEKVWNLLYVSANSAADAVLTELQADKAALLLDGEDGGRKGKVLKDEGANVAGKNTAAATVALMEAHLLNQTKAWIKAEGISLQAFERRGNTLLTAAYRQNNERGQNGSCLDAGKDTGDSRTASSCGGRGDAEDGGGSDCTRSRDTLIVKHLPTAHVDGAELLRLFERVGPLARFLLAPSKTVAIVQYEREKDAEVAFRRLAYRQYKNVPLFLEKAPVNVFVEREEEMQAARKRAAEEVRAAKKRKVKDIEELIGNDATGDDFEEEVQGVSLFVKNVNFSTSEATLNDVFAGCPGLRRTKLMTKKKAITSNATGSTENGDDPQSAASLSMGYAFVEFDSAANALAACKRMQGVVVDDHVLQISISRASGAHRRVPGTGAKARGGASSAGGKGHQAQSNKVLVKNLAFQASASDLRGLFSAYGNVTRVCIPRQHEGRSRGFAFVDFATKQEAQNAVDALSGSHLYGRRLVLEPANQEHVSKKAAI
ncbi:probable RNA-binding protein 19, related [Neospora caninum Liverpool]|uniref:Probable RNA-binding protein 19, related n=1 Tax=Neospora caninum (strain Liverpool) TaxID=572307 RepID=F0VAD0_NEOCL|nr:probable RNA-binding protein 19, related [Neospora caninum Liverpool]CBZ50619.1 probable RNA-binding protein 19, related [Neospora caninum Liverpool]|eukprot:XP_003880652.1 probable RNA-binding protein 19, related [Neospora caninum Liverpool]